MDIKKNVAFKVCTGLLLGILVIALGGPLVFSQGCPPINTCPPRTTPTPVLCITGLCEEWQPDGYCIICEG
jgi:hypothetical protein